MKVSISRHDYIDKNQIDWKNVCYKEIEVTDLSLLNWYISKGYCYCAIFKHDGDILRQSDKTEKNFIETNIISIDLDDRDQTYETFTYIMRDTDIMPSLIYTTANNRIKGNRYRALYVTDKPITSTAEYGSIYNGIIKEIASHTNEPMKDNCGHSVAQQMAGNGTPTFQSTLGDIWSLEELKERYNVNDTMNEGITSMPANGNDNENNVKSATPLYNRMTNNNGNEKVPHRYIIGKMLYKSATPLYNKEEERNIIYPFGTFEEIEKLPFIQDYYTLPLHDIVTKYMDVYPSIEATPIEFNDNELYKVLGDDYLELKRGGYFNKVTMKNGNEVTMWTARKRKNGEGRKKHIYFNLVLRRLIYPAAKLDYLLYCGLYELDYYTDNTQEPITKYEIAQIAINAYLTDLNKWQKLKEYNRKKFKVNKEYCKKNGMNARCVALSIANTMKKSKSTNQYERIKELYNIDLTDKQNIEEMEKKEFKISLRTLKRWKKANGIKKNKKRVSTDNTEKAILSTSICASGQLPTNDNKHTNMNDINGKNENVMPASMASTSTVEMSVSPKDIKANGNEETAKDITAKNGNMTNDNASVEQLPTENEKTQQSAKDTAKMTLSEVVETCQTIEDVLKVDWDAYKVEIMKDIKPLLLDKRFYCADTFKDGLKFLFNTNYNAFVFQIKRYMESDIMTPEEKEEIKGYFDFNKKKIA